MLLGQFMQPDNYIQSPEEFVSYNRYNYCRGNPFKWTDPSGEYWEKQLTGAISEEWVWVEDYNWLLNRNSSYSPSSTPSLLGPVINTIKGPMNTGGWGSGGPGGSYLARQSTRNSSSGIIAGALPEKPSISADDVVVSLGYPNNSVLLVDPMMQQNVDLSCQLTINTYQGEFGTYSDMYVGIELGNSSVNIAVENSPDRGNDIMISATVMSGVFGIYAFKNAELIGWSVRASGEVLMKGTSTWTVVKGLKRVGVAGCAFSVGMAGYNIVTDAHQEDGSWDASAVNPWDVADLGMGLTGLAVALPFIAMTPVGIIAGGVVVAYFIVRTGMEIYNHMEDKKTKKYPQYREGGTIGF